MTKMPRDTLTTEDLFSGSFVQKHLFESKDTEDFMVGSVMQKLLSDNPFSKALDQADQAQKEQAQSYFVRYLQNAERKVYENKEQMVNALFFMFSMAIYFGYIKEDSPTINQAIEDVSTQNNFDLSSAALLLILAATNNWQASALLYGVSQIPQAKAKEIKDSEFQHLDGRMEKGRFLFDRGKYQEAIVVLSELIKLDPNNIENYKLLGSSYHAIGNFREGEKILSQGLALNPDDVDMKRIIEEAAIDKKITMSLSLGLWNLEHGSWFESGKTEGYFNQAFALKDHLSASQSFMVGEGFFALGKYEKAIECYSKTLSLNPHDYTTNNAIGYSLTYLGREAEAIKFFEKAIKLDPGKASPYSGLGNALLSMGQYERASENFAKAAGLMPVISKTALISKKFESTMFNKLYSDMRFYLSKGPDFVQENFGQILATGFAMMVGIGLIQHRNFEQKMAQADSNSRKFKLPSGEIELFSKDENIDRWARAMSGVFEIGGTLDEMSNIKNPEELKTLLLILSDHEIPEAKNLEKYSEPFQIIAAELIEMKKTEFRPSTINLGKIHHASGTAVNPTNKPYMTRFLEALNVIEKSTPNASDQMQGAIKVLREAFAEVPKAKVENPLERKLSNVKDELVEKSH